MAIESNFEPGVAEGLVLREWALRTLGNQGAAGSDLRSALVQQLPAQEFVPPVPLFYAARSQWDPLSDAGLNQIASTLIAEVDALMKPEIEDFCRSFFLMNCDIRRAKWQELRTRAVISPYLSARLDALVVGLDVDVEAVNRDESELRRLAGFIQEAFVLLPADRAHRRQAFLTTCELERAKWRAASWRLARRFPKIVDLDPYLIKRLRCLRANWLGIRKFRIKEPARNQMSPRQNALWIVVSAGVFGGIVSSQFFDSKSQFPKSDTRPIQVEPDLMRLRDVRRLNAPGGLPPNFKDLVTPRRFSSPAPDASPGRRSPGLAPSLGNPPRAR